jgi:hypothetical protein
VQGRLRRKARPRRCSCGEGYRKLRNVSTRLFFWLTNTGDAQPLTPPGAASLLLAPVLPYLLAPPSRLGEAAHERPVSGFRDRAETAGMPHHNWSLGPGGIKRGMNLGRGVFCDPSATERDSAARMGKRHCRLTASQRRSRRPHLAQRRSPESADHSALQPLACRGCGDSSTCVGGSSAGPKSLKRVCRNLVTPSCARSRRRLATSIARLSLAPRRSSGRLRLARVRRRSGRHR